MLKPNPIEQRLTERGIILPSVSAPAANYVPYVQTGNLVFISGQVTMRDGKLDYIGKVGVDFTIEQGQKAAELCALNLLAHLKNACGGDLSRVRRVVKLGGFVHCTADFVDHPKVMNGASDLMVAVFGEAGRHARFAVGAPSLPFGIAVEVDGIFEITDHPE